MVSRARAPSGLALSELRVSQFYVKSPGDRVDLDDVTVLQQCDRTADRGFRPDMADAEAPRGPRAAAVSDEGDLAPHSLPRQCGGRRKHFAHSRAAARPLIADDDDLAFLVGLLLDRLESVLFAIEAA